MQLHKNINSKSFDVLENKPLHTLKIKKYYIKVTIEISLMLICAGLTWWAVSNFQLSSDEGFDPYRYEYFAINKNLPSYYADSTSYHIVLLLQWLYVYLPPYVGFILFIGLLCLSLRFVDRERRITLAIFSPISFYYLPQTGKDGISILVLIAVALAINNFRQYRVLLLSFIFMFLAFFIRPPLGLTIAIVAIQFRFGTKYAIAAIPFLLFLVFLFIPMGAIVETLRDTASQGGSGMMIASFRELSFGYSIESISLRVGLLLFSIVFQPFVEIVKVVHGAGMYVALECLVLWLFFLNLLRRKILFRFIMALAPYAIIIGVVSPFYHFRYMFIIYPIVYIYCIYAPYWLWIAQMKKILKVHYGVI